MNRPQLRQLIQTTIVLLGMSGMGTAQEKPDPQVREEKRESEREEGKDTQRDGENEKFARMKRAIQELNRAGKHDEAERMQHELAAAWERRGGDKRAPKASEGPERIRHIQEAIKHLREAGLPEPAQHLEQVADKLRAEFERQRQEQSKREAQAEGRDDGLRELRKELEQARAQLQKMSQEIQELRGQLKGQGERDPRKN